MSLYDFFFPEQAQAKHLRTLSTKARYRERVAERRARAEQQRREQQAATTSAFEERIAELEQDLGFVSLVLASLLQASEEQGVLTRELVRETVLQLDDVDGVRDGRLDVNILRGKIS